MITLRPYQLDAIEAIKNGFFQSNRQYIEMPTGSGKTITFLSFAQTCSSYILIIVPSKELLNQVYQTCLIFWEPHQISRKGNGYDEELSNVHICIINSLNERYLDEISTGEFGLIIFDEVHHIQSKSYRRVIDTFSKSQIISPLFLGVTATPDRADGKLLEELLYNKTFKMNIENLINQNHLSDVEGYCVKTNIDISGIDSHNGDFSISELYKRLSTGKRNELVIDICKNEMKSRKTLVFCINVKHSMEISKLLNENGLSSRAIYGSMNEKEKQAILKSFRSGEIEYLCNCQLLTEGFDEPSIDGIVLARPTRSRALFLQMIGRGLRIFKGKNNCKIVDIVDSHQSLAGVTSLIGEERYKEIVSFKSIKCIRKHIDDEELSYTKTKIERVDFFENKIQQFSPTEAMKQYLNDYGIEFYESVSFDEASFLIWFNELKKRYYNGLN
jgi:superfamily II DNA or RNA helicase